MFHKNESVVYEVEIIQSEAKTSAGHEIICKALAGKSMANSSQHFSAAVKVATPVKYQQKKTKPQKTPTTIGTYRKALQNNSLSKVYVRSCFEYTESVRFP